MQKITKGALASGAAALLLIGGGSTLALWSDQETVKGGTIATGDLRFVDVVSEEIAVTGLADGGTSQEFASSYTVKLEGLTNAKLEFTTPALDDTTDAAVAEVLDVDSVLQIDGTAPSAEPDDSFTVENGDVVTVLTTVSLDTGSTEASNDLAADLSGIEVEEGTVTLTQLPASETP